MPNNFGLVPVDKSAVDKSKQPLLTGDLLCTATVSSLKCTSDQSFARQIQPNSKITIFAIEMKLLATIWIVFILFLTAYPSVSNLFASQSETCIEENCCEKKESTDDCCPNDKNCGMMVCNPFMVCCNCNAIPSQIQTIAAPVSFSTQYHFSIPSENGCDFTTEAWNPPKTI